MGLDSKVPTAEDLQEFLNKIPSETKYKQLESNVSAMQSASWSARAELRNYVSQQARASGLTFASEEDLRNRFEDRKVEKVEGNLTFYRVSSGKGIRESLFYQCETCGIVPGMPSEERFDDIRILSGARGVNYNCNLCGLNIGQRVEAQS